MGDCGLTSKTIGVSSLAPRALRGTAAAGLLEQLQVILARWESGDFKGVVIFDCERSREAADRSGTSFRPHWHSDWRVHPEWYLRRDRGQ